VTELLDRIPVLDLSPEHEALWNEIRDEALRVLRSGRFILGPDVEDFERAAADYLGVKHAIGLNSGTDALVIGLRALGVQPGDEVITTAFTFFATAEAISLLGATPVFVDIDEESFNIDPGRIESAINERTRVIIPVHLFGRPADWERIAMVAGRRGIPILEDCAQSIGAGVGGRMTGSLGDAGAFSFYPTKNLGAFGDGGLLVTGDDRVAEETRMLRTHGERSRYHNEMLGYNSRLDALQAALLHVKLRHLDEFNAGRRRAAVMYDRLLAGVDGVTAPRVTDGHVFHQYTVRVHGGRRDEVRARMDEAGVGTMVYYPIPCHRLPVYADEYADVYLPVTELVAGEVLSLPIWPSIDEAVQTRVVGALREALGA